MPRALLPLVLLAALLLALPFPAQRADAEPAAPSFSKSVDAWEKVLNRAAERLDGGDFADADLEALRGELSAVFNEARGAGASAHGGLAQARQLIDALGPAPAEGGQAESREVVAERERLTRELAELDGRVRQAELVATRADILMRTATSLRMDQFKATLLKRDRLPVSLETWREVPAQLTFLGDRMRRALVRALGFDAWDYRLAGLVALTLASLGFAWSGRRGLLRRWGHRPVAVAPSYRQKVVAAAVEATARCLLPVVPTLAITLAMLAMLGGDPALAPLVAAVTAGSGGLVFFFLISGLARATLAPDHSDWRLAEIGDDCARPMAHRVKVFAAGLAVAGSVFTMFRLQLAPPELAAVAGFAVQLVAALTLFPLLPGRFWSPASGEGGCGCEPEAAEDEAETGAAAALRRQSRRGLRLLAALTAVSALAASAAGYHNLSVYVATLALATLALGGMLLMLRGVLRELVSLLVEEQSGPIASVRRTVIRTDGGLKAFDWVTRSLLDVALLGVGLVVLLPLSGMDWTELGGLAEGIWRGVSIGGIRIAPADILTAAGSFALVVTVTRFVQRQLDERVLQRLQIDRGVQHSIRTGIGYLGVAVALLAAVGSLGLDLSSLALIAGALSVGIGFGLQAVVSNFVAGLILLVERPIKVGDWVVVGDKEGLVRRISVRSTEIQTFQRSSVIIPNSELISSSVLNWTFKDRFGRVEIRVRVAYGTDPRKARDLLLSCTVGDRRISRTPAPQAVLRDLGPSALEFELRCFVADVDDLLTVQSDLRFAIVDAFALHGIEIPYAQQVVHMPQFEALRATVEGRPAALAVQEEPANDGPAVRVGAKL